MTASAYNGVYYVPSVGLWEARVRLALGRWMRIARFERDEDAAAAWDRVVTKLELDDPRNFPGRKLRPASVEEIRAEVRLSHKERKTSRFFGVYCSLGRRGERPWTASVRVHDRDVQLGSWATPREAALAYDRATLFYRGGLGQLNFPDEARRLGPADMRVLRAMSERARKECTTSKYRGVIWFATSSCWRARITHERKLIHLGLFDDELDAALAYDAKALALRGPAAKINFPSAR